MRTTGQKLRVDEAGDGSSISPGSQLRAVVRKRRPLLTPFLVLWRNGCCQSRAEQSSPSKAVRLPADHTVLRVGFAQWNDSPWRLTISIGHSSWFGRHSWSTSSSHKLPAAKLSHRGPERKCKRLPACPMSSKRTDMPAHRTSMLAPRNTSQTTQLRRAAGQPQVKLPRPRCSAMVPRRVVMIQPSATLQTRVTSEIPSGADSPRTDHS